jgi:hypothetical protein
MSTFIESPSSESVSEEVQNSDSEVERWPRSSNKKDEYGSSPQNSRYIPPQQRRAKAEAASSESRYIPPHLRRQGSIGISPEARPREEIGQQNESGSTSKVDSPTCDLLIEGFQKIELSTPTPKPAIAMSNPTSSKISSPNTATDTKIKFDDRNSAGNSGGKKKNSLEKPRAPLQFSSDAVADSVAEDYSDMKDCCILAQGFHANLPEYSRELILKPFVARGGLVRWVSPGEAIVVFTSAAQAQAALSAPHNALVKVQLLAEIIDKFKMKQLCQGEQSLTHSAHVHAHSLTSSSLTY